MAAERPERLERLPVIDLLRLIAALAVVGYHLTPPIAVRARRSYVDFYGAHLWHGTRYGWLGVPLFFLISGFVIPMSSWGRTAAQFATSRVARLWPAYLTGVLLTSLVLTVWPPPGQLRPPIASIIANLTMLQQPLGVGDIDPVYWSLVVELKFYLIFTLAVVWRGCSYRRVVLFCFLWLAAGVLAQGANFAPLLVLLEPGWAPFFVGGITLYLMYRFGRSLLLWSMLATSWALATHSTVLVVQQHDGFGEWLNPVTAGLVATGCYAVMTAVALGWFGWLRWRGLVLCGALSYPIYLLHNGIGVTAVRVLPGALGWPAVAAIVAVGLFVAAYAVHRFVERPGSRAIKRGLRASFERIRLADADAVRPVSPPLTTPPPVPAEPAEPVQA